MKYTSNKIIESLSNSLSSQEIVTYCLKNYPDLVLVNSWGEKALFYNPQNSLKRGVYVLTIKEKDGPNDVASEINRENVYRVNFGIGKEQFIKLFGTVPKRPKAGETAAMSCDYTALNTLMPHPVYAWMGWVSILNPSKEIFLDVIPLIDLAYTIAKQKFLSRKK
jgi:hypothetical protein